MIKKLILVFLICLCFYSNKAAIVTATASGNWGTASTWSANPPACGDIIIIPVGITVTMDATYSYACPTLTMAVYINGCLKFTNSNRLELPCNGTNYSAVYISSTGSMVPGVGGGSSAWLKICGTKEWTAGAGNATGPSCFPQNTTPPCSTVPLPVEFIAFTGNLEVKVVFLAWKTITETNNAYFDVEKSVDGINFEKFTSVKSQAIGGNSVKLLTYNAIDIELKNPIYYYRLKQVDLDGTYKYSNSISVKIDSPELKIYPNPNNGSFWIDVPTAKTNQKLM